VVSIPIAAWLQRLAAQVRSVPVTPAIADTAVSLPSSFPGDPADRLIYVTRRCPATRLTCASGA
jgi:PIN domain nuclease of toxin-antitoxin system